MLKINFKEHLKELIYIYAAVTFGLIASLFVYSLDFFSINFWMTAVLAYLIVTALDFFVLSVLDDQKITAANFLFRVMVLVVVMQIAFAGIYYLASTGTTYIVKDGIPVKDFSDCMYFSGVTLLTVGYGDITPVGDFRFTAVAEVYGGTIFIFSFFALGLSVIANRHRKN